MDGLAYHAISSDRLPSRVAAATGFAPRMQHRRRRRVCCAGRRRRAGRRARVWRNGRVALRNGCGVRADAAGLPPSFVETTEPARRGFGGGFGLGTAARKASTNSWSVVKSSRESGAFFFAGTPK